MDPFIYLIFQNVDLFIYCPSIFCTHLLLLVRQISLKSLSENYVQIPGCQKNGAFHIGIQKNSVIHILSVETRGPIIYLAALKKWASRHAHLYYAIYRKLPHPRPRGTSLPKTIYRRTLHVICYFPQHVIYLYYPMIPYSAVCLHRLFNFLYIKKQGRQICDILIVDQFQFSPLTARNLKVNKNK